jgi:hypothetical protein
MYNVYLNYDGCALEFIGRAQSLAQAQSWADQEREAVSEEHEWSSHRAAGASHLYPASEVDGEDNIWLDSDMPYVAVLVAD